MLLLTIVYCTIRHTFSQVFSAKINAKAFSLDEFYGKADTNAPDEFLGIFPKILKTFLSDISPREETVYHSRSNLISKIEPREMVFEDGRVVYQPRDEKDLDNSGIPLLRTANFKARTPSEILLNKKVYYTYMSNDLAKYVQDTCSTSFSLSLCFHYLADPADEQKVICENNFFSISDGRSFEKEIKVSEEREL